MPKLMRYSKSKGRGVLRKRKEGWTLNEIAAAYKVSTRSISNWLVRAETEIEEKKSKVKTKKTKKRELVGRIEQSVSIDKADYDKGVSSCPSCSVEAIKKIRNVLDEPSKSADASTSDKPKPDGVPTSILLKEMAYLQWWKEGELNGWVRRLLEDFANCQEEPNVENVLPSLGILRDTK